MSARNRLPARAFERNALAAAIARHAPRGDVRVAEALAAVAVNRRRRAERVWDGVLAATLPPLEELFVDLPEQPISARADAAWSAACRRIAARALAGAAPDPTRGAYRALPADAAPPLDAPCPTACIGPYAFYRSAAG